MAEGFYSPTIYRPKQFVKLNTVNMSFRLPDFVYRRLLRQAERQLSKKVMVTTSLENKNSIEPINMYEIFIVREIRKIYGKLKKRWDQHKQPNRKKAVAKIV